MSMPHGETTGRTHPCTQCGAGAHHAQPVDTIPLNAHKLCIVRGDATVNVHTEPGVYEAVGQHLVIGYPLLQRGDQVLMWVRSFAFPMVKSRSDGLAFERRSELQRALLSVKVDGFENVGVCWVSARDVACATLSPADGYYLPDVLTVGGEWFYSYVLCLDYPNLAPPFAGELDYTNVRKEIKENGHIKPKLPDSVMHWLKGWREVPDPPPAPVLQPLSAEGVGLMAGLDADIKLLDDLRAPIMPLDQMADKFFGGGIKKGELHMIAAKPGNGKAAFPLDWKKLADIPMMRMPSALIDKPAPALAQNLPKFRPGDAVVWDVAKCGYHFCATVSQVRGNEVRIKLRDGQDGWEHFKKMNLCPAWMQHWKTLDGHLWVSDNDGKLRRDPFINAVMPPVCTPPVGVIFASDTPPEAPDRVVVSIPSFNTEVPPPVMDDTPLDAEEEGEVWSAFARYCATLNLDTPTSQAEAERALDFFVKMRRKLCNMLE